MDTDSLDRGKHVGDSLLEPGSDQGTASAGGKWQVCNRWFIQLGLFLHIFLVIIQLVLLMIVTCHHPEHRITIPTANYEITIGLSGGLQAFYTIYTTLLVFLTEGLMLSTALSGPVKLTRVHDICGAWGGLGAALKTIREQAKVSSSILSVTLVLLYIIGASVLHVTSSTLMNFQPFNATVTRTVPALATWPDPISEFTSSGWEYAAASLSSYMQNLFGDTTPGLVNSTLYDVPLASFLDATINATTVNSHCGLLTNLSLGSDDGIRSINVSMTGLEPLNFEGFNPPLPNEVWFTFPNGLAQPFITYLVSVAIEADESVGSDSYIYINGTFSPPDGVSQNFTTQIYLIACYFDTTSTAGSSSALLASGEQQTDVIWPIFSPGGDTNLTLAILSGMVGGSTGNLPRSPHCLPVMEEPYWQNMTTFDSYMTSALGIGLSPCGATSIEQYTGTPYPLTRDRLEKVTSQIAAEFVWLAGQLGKAGGGFDRQTEEVQITEYVLTWQLNINVLPVSGQHLREKSVSPRKTIFSFCASLVLCIIAICVARSRNSQHAISPTTGVLEIMWFGSRSRFLRDRMRRISKPSLDALRAASIFEMVLWTRSPYYGWSPDQKFCDFYAPVPFCEMEDHESLETFTNEYDEKLNSGLHAGQPGSRTRSRRWCYALHITLVSLHLVLLSLLIRHPEHSVVIPFENTTWTVGLSAFLQAIYTIYSAVLIFVFQRLSLYKIISERRKLTTVHDISGAWTGIGAAILTLWQQRKVASSPLEVLAIVVYFASMVVLHVASSSIMQWQAFDNSVPVGTFQSNLALPNNAVNISQLEWADISPVACSTGQDSNLSTYGLSNGTIYDMPQVPVNSTVSDAIINATTFDVKCGLVPNITLLSDELVYPIPGLPVQYQTGMGRYQIGFSLDGTDNNTLLGPPTWKDLLIRIDGQCADCAQTLFYVMTTAIDVDESVHDPVALNLNWTYVSPSGANPQNSTTVTYVAACSISTNTVPTTLNLQEKTLVMPLVQSDLPTSTSWSVWSPLPATNLSVGMVTALSQFYMAYDGSLGNSSAFYSTTMDNYIMSLVGLSWTAAEGTAATHSSADPSAFLTPAQLENAISQTAARFLWLAGQLGESNGGFNRTVGESPAFQNLLQWRLNVNTVPVIFAFSASCIALAVAIFILGRKPIHECPSSVSGTSVLESLWLEANSEVLHSRLQGVKEPRPDELREAGMFDICLEDVAACTSCQASVLEGATLNSDVDDVNPIRMIA